MECGDVINISDVSVWVSGLGLMDMLLFAISEEYFNINWTSSTNKIRSIELIKVYSAIFLVLLPKYHVIFTRT